MTKSIFLLVTTEMKPIPKKVQVVQIFGRETVLDDSGFRQVHGDVAHVKAEPCDLVDWLKAAPGIWAKENRVLPWKYIPLQEGYSNPATSRTVSA